MKRGLEQVLDDTTSTVEQCSAKAAKTNSVLDIQRHDRAVCFQPSEIEKSVLEKGFLEFPEGVPWVWELMSFVEQMHEKYEKLVEEELDKLRDDWDPYGSAGRPGGSAAWKATEALEKVGIAVYTPPPSQSAEMPFHSSGPRFYVSVTAAAWQKWPGGAPAPPGDLSHALWPHQADRGLVDGQWPNMIRGLGWALAPPCADPQTLHADIWGGEDKPRPGRVRFHHILWKRQKGLSCTTQVVPRGFTNGRCTEIDYALLESVSSPCIIVDNEVLHRGAPNKSNSWASTCSIELCTRTGYDDVWKGGSEDDGVYKMLPIQWSEARVEE